MPGLSVVSGFVSRMFLASSSGLKGVAAFLGVAFRADALVVGGGPASSANSAS